MDNPNLSAIYKDLCESYRAIDDFRMKLLGALPLATGTGIFLLVNKDSDALALKYGGPVGLFGFVVTMGLAFYEMYGIKKCAALIQTGKKLEIQMRVPGQFLTRPDPLLGFVYEPLAAGLIYPAVLAAWTFVAFYSSPARAYCAAIVVFVVGLAFSASYHWWLKGWRSPELATWLADHTTSASTGPEGTPGSTPKASAS